MRWSGSPCTRSSSSRCTSCGTRTRPSSSTRGGSTSSRSRRPFPRAPERPAVARTLLAECLRSSSSRTTPRGRPAAAPSSDLADWIVRGDAATRSLLGVTGSRQDVHGRHADRAAAAARRWSSRPTRRWPPSCTASSRRSSRRTRSSTSSPTTTTTSPRPTSRSRTPTSRRTRSSTTRSTACATRRPSRSSSGGTCVIVASVSCIYGIGAPETYHGHARRAGGGRGASSRDDDPPAARRASSTSATTTTSTGGPSACGATWSRSSRWPPRASALRVELFGDTVERHPPHRPAEGPGRRSGSTASRIYPASHYVTPAEQLERAAGDHQGGAAASG